MRRVTLRNAACGVAFAVGYKMQVREVARVCARGSSGVRVRNRVYTLHHAKSERTCHVLRYRFHAPRRYAQRRPRESGRDAAKMAFILCHCALPRVRTMRRYC